MKLLKLGTVALDGTKMHANASRHSALSYGHAEQLEAQLHVEVAELLARAEGGRSRTRRVVVGDHGVEHPSDGGAEGLKTGLGSIRTPSFHRI